MTGYKMPKSAILQGKMAFFAILLPVILLNFSMNTKPIQILITALDSAQFFLHFENWLSLKI